MKDVFYTGVWQYKVMWQYKSCSLSDKAKDTVHYTTWPPLPLWYGIQISLFMYQI